jgi:Putative transmembrane protein (PGPGW)
MIESVKRYAWRQWQSFSRGRPGKRFQERYRRRQQHGHGPWGVRRVFNLTLGILIVAVSAVGGLLPGPGWGTAIIGFALIAGEFLPAARLLDRIELQLRAFWQFVRDIWGHSWAGKVLVITAAALVVATLGYAVYTLLFAR